MPDWYPNNSISAAAYTGGNIGQFVNYGQNLNPGYGLLGAQQAAYGMPTTVATQPRPVQPQVGAPQSAMDDYSWATQGMTQPDFYTDADFTDPTVSYGYLVPGMDYSFPYDLGSGGTTPAPTYTMSDFLTALQGSAYSPPSNWWNSIMSNPVQTVATPTAPTPTPTAPVATPQPTQSQAVPAPNPKSTSIADLSQKVANATQGTNNSPAEAVASATGDKSASSTDLTANLGGGGGIGKSTTYKSPWLAYGGWKF